MNTPHDRERPAVLREDPEGPIARLRAELEAQSEVGVRRVLLSITNLNTPELRSGDRALHLLAEYDHADGIRQALRRNADPELPNLFHRTALHIAAHFGSLRALDALLDARVAVNTVSCDGSRPIFDAIMYGRRDAALRLLQYSGELSRTRNANLETPLHTLAHTTGDVVIGKALLDTGALLDAQDIDNDTPLHPSVEYGHEPLTRLLLKAGAHTSLVNRLGLTPDLMPAAIAGRNVDRCAMLVAHTRWVRQMMRFASNPANLVLLGG